MSVNSKYYEPGDVKLVKALLVRPGEGVSVDIRGQIISLSIFEDVEQPTMTADIVMMDSINLLQDFPIVGEEVLNLSFYTPQRENPTRLTFNVYSVEGQTNSPTSKGSSYVLKCVSPLHYFNAKNIIEKSYETIVSEVVTDILANATSTVDVAKLRVNIEPTKGLIPLTISKMRPFEAVDFLRQRAVSEEFASGGAYLFFENQYGVHFRSVEHLMKEGKNSIGSKKFTYAPGVKFDKTRQAFEMRNIINYVALGKFDSINKIQKGTFNTDVEFFDIHTKDYGSSNFSISEKSNIFSTTDKKGRMPNSATFINKHDKTTAVKYFVPRDTSKGQDYMDVTLGSKNALAQLINQQQVRILVPGDNYLSVGDIVDLGLPEVSGTTERKSTDRLSSGNYLVTKLRHTITMEEGGKPKHYTSMDCAKIGYK